MKQDLSLTVVCYLPAEIRELFRLFDKNKDNTISGSELGKMLHCMGMSVSQSEIANIMKDLDKNGESVSQLVSE